MPCLTRGWNPLAALKGLRTLDLWQTPRERRGAGAPPFGTPTPRVDTGLALDRALRNPSSYHLSRRTRAPSGSFDGAIAYSPPHQNRLYMHTTGSLHCGSVPGKSGARMPELEPRVIDISFATFLRGLGATPSPGPGGDCGSGCWCSCSRRSWPWLWTPRCAGSRRVACADLDGVLLLAFCLVLVLAVFVAVSGASIAEQTRVLGSRVGEFRQEVMTRIPERCSRLVRRWPIR